MILYHGTNLKSAQLIYKNQTVDLKYSHKKTDFGRGFYMTDDLEYARNWAFRKSFYRNDDFAVVKIDIDSDSARTYIETFHDDLRWGRFTINNRNGIEYITNVSFKEHNLDARYHITCGRIADINVLKIANDLRASNKMLQSIEEIWNRNFPLQYSLHSEFAIKFIRNITYTSI